MKHKLLIVTDYSETHTENFVAHMEEFFKGKDIEFKILIVDLKSNKKVIGSKNGYKIWSWDWNEIARDLGLTGSSTGVMATEVKEKNPEAVGEKDGFMIVNYEMIGI